MENAVYCDYPPFRWIRTRKGWPDLANKKQILMQVNLTIILLTAAFLNLSASGISQKVNFSGKDVALEKVFQEVEKQTGYVFFYDANLVKEVKPVTVHASNLSLEQFMNKVLADQPLSFSIRK